MFTIPVGNFKRAATGYRPSANSVTTTPIGSVTDVANAYDADPSTFSYHSSSTGTTSTVFSGFSAVTSASAVLNLAIIAAINDVSTSLVTVDISYNGGSSYDFSVPLTWYSYGPSTWITNLLDKNVLFSIPDGISLASIKIKVNTGTCAGCSIQIYDIVINQ